MHITGVGSKRMLCENCNDTSVGIRTEFLVQLSDYSGTTLSVPQFKVFPHVKFSVNDPERFIKIS